MILFDNYHYSLMTYIGENESDIDVEFLFIDEKTKKYLTENEHTLLSEMSPQRREKTENITNVDKRNESLGATILLDHLLKKRNLSENEIKYTYNENGKPYFANCPDLFFSVSHCDNVILVCVAPFEIGCDVERENEKVKWEKIANRFFTENECKSVKSVNQFFDLWVKKEAYTKLLGKGISSLPLKSYDVLNDEKIKECNLRPSKAEIL